MHVVPREDWLKARLALMAKEKALTRMRDELAAERRALPAVRVEQDYVFDAMGGKQTLADLFQGNSQLIVYHFMLGPDWENPCKSCSFWAEHFDGVRTHLTRRDANLVAVSRAPLSKILELKQRFGWRFPWVSSLGSTFNFDFGVSFTDAQDGVLLYNFATQQASRGELPGLSVFAQNADGAILHTYSTYARGLDALNGTYQLLDVLPQGRNEDERNPTSWLRLKDRYE